MRIVILALLSLLMSVGAAWGQTESGDTTIYTALPEPPRFPACEDLDTTLSAKNQCAQRSLLSFMYQNLVYPMEARQQNLEGDVVVSFVVEKDGSLTNFEILKDIGGGAGSEVLRLLEVMNEGDIAWVPGKKDGKVVRSRFTMPIKFKLEEAKPYMMLGGDSVYTEYDTPLRFKGGGEALQAFMAEELVYPEQGNDSCDIGRIEVQILVKPNGEVRILDVTDYSDLGFDYWYAAIDAATSTYGRWEPATYDGRKVGAAFDLSLPFLPEREACAAKIETYQRANKLANDGADLFNGGEKDKGLAKLSEAVALFPRNADFLLMRGQAYLDLQEFEKACADLRLARRIALVSYYDSVLSVICNQQ